MFSRVRVLGLRLGLGLVQRIRLELYTREKLLHMIMYMNMIIVPITGFPKKVCGRGPETKD